MVGSAGADPPNLKKYGVPSYSVAWIPPNVIKSVANQTIGEASDNTDSSPPQPPEQFGEHCLAITGGGGEGSSGIPNAVLLAHFDVASNSLSDQLVGRLGTDSELPYRMALHPGGDGLICAMPKSCRWFEWNQNKSAESHKLGLKVSDKVLSELEDVGQQLALAFDNDGTMLAVGGEDGNLRVFKWPSMEIILNETKAYSTVKDLHFSSDGKLLVSLGSGGPCRVWDVSSSMVLTSISSKNGEVFSSCRFSQINDRTQVLYIAAMTDKGGSILTWDAKTGARIGSKHIIRDAISAFNVSTDGKLVACGTPSGDIVIVNSTNMRILSMIKRAHLGIVTALAFSHDSRVLASVSFDSSARVTVIEEKQKNEGLSLWIAVLFIILAIAAAYFLKLQDIDKLKLYFLQN
ncbi:SEC12-like protein 2 [Neltuma alba]|uniref:SEC12-like protein 2 n=1 Tax=Neltuma alba TaxID=207710 RepID=UPI0010A3BF65|nr:SEC12-like protein 2 [Prosopis alba]XP_028759004.1 SEC12-like protein 2 [Prosopis alba]